jgi:hypothetical protein
VRVLLAILLGVPAAARASDVRLELAVGAGGALDSSVLAPVLSVRAGMDLWEFFEPGLRVTGVLGPEGVDFIPGGSGGSGAGNRAWSVLGELRFHNPGRFQGMFQLGIGIGRLVRARTDTDETVATVGELGVATQAGVGFRAFVAPRLALGIELDVMNWHSTGPPPGFIPGTSFGAVPGPSAAGVCLCGSIAIGFAP